MSLEDIVAGAKIVAGTRTDRRTILNNLKKMEEEGEIETVWEVEVLACGEELYSEYYDRPTPCYRLTEDFRPDEALKTKLLAAARRKVAAADMLLRRECPTSKENLSLSVKLMQIDQLLARIEEAA